MRDQNDLGDFAPVAEYLRMSTDHQKYSFDNQRAAIAEYAAAHRMKVVRAYEDAGKSGLTYNRRPGLQSLVEDAADPMRGYKTVLVFDISRWGRFQDADESAFYEYLMKRSGVNVVYCAEQFDNDGTPVTTIIKSVKRVMAAEFSRELSKKVSAGQRRISKLGYRMGSNAGYGLRRMTVDESGERGVVLEQGQRKAIATHRIKLIPGPKEEVAVVRRIYDWYVFDQKMPEEIAALLHAEGVPPTGFKRWQRHIVARILKHEKYMGVSIFGRERSQLPKDRIAVPMDDWVIIEGAFEPIIERHMFEAAQRLRLSRVKAFSNEEILVGLTKLLSSRGFLTRAEITKTARLPSVTCIKERFGGLDVAYAAIGYVQPAPLELRSLAKRYRADKSRAKRRHVP